MRFDRRYLYPWLVGALLLGLPTAAAAQGAGHRAQVNVQPLFGDGTLLAEGWSTVLIDVENLTRADQRGELHLTVQSYRGIAMRAEMPFDVPARQTRRATVPVFGSDSASAIRAEFRRADGRVLGAGQVSTDYSSAQRSVVVFGDPPRLRGALLDLDLQDLAANRQVRYPVGAVRFDPATRDPQLPESVGMWSTVRLLVASADVLERVSAPQRAAIEDWLRTGGQLLVFPRSEIDLRRPWLLALAGPIDTDGEPPEPSQMVPAGGTRFALACSRGQRPEAFGCSRAYGVGRVYVAGYDGSSPAALESGSARSLVAALLAAPAARTALDFGRGAEGLGLQSDNGSLGAMRAVLDPNEGFRPALLLVSLVLFFYVVLIGPVNFAFVQRRNQPTLALVTTPLVATSCVLVLVAVGYIGKGVTMRYRRIELVESVEGQSRAPARRYTSLFSTRPGGFELPGQAPGTLTRRIGGDFGHSPSHRIEGGETRLVDFRAGLWETTFIREDRMVELGGEIRFERDGQILAAVVNESDLSLSGAVLIDTTGEVYRIGDVPAGGRAEIPRLSEASVNVDGARTMATLTGADDDPDETDRVSALIRLLGDRFVPTVAPVLYARAPASEAPIGIFSAELDQRWVRIRPLFNGPPVPPAPPLEMDPYAMEEVPPLDLEPPLGASPDASGDAAPPALDGGAP